MENPRPQLPAPTPPMAPLPVPVHPPIAPIPVPPPRAPAAASVASTSAAAGGGGGGEAEYEVSDDHRAARERHERAVQELLQRRRAYAMAVPTNDSAVRARLRRLGEPITLYGEREMERRDRLRALMVRLEAEGQVDRLLRAQEDDQAAAAGAGEEDEEQIQYPFFTEGTQELLKARVDIAQYSLPRAKVRIERAKRRLEDPDEDPEVEADLVVKQAGEFVLECSEIGDDRPLTGCSFSRDASMLATSSWSGMIKVWSMPQITKVATLKGHTERATDVAFSPADDCLATASADKTAKLWKPDGSLLMSFDGHLDRLARVAFHPSGKYLGTASFDKTWRLWDINTGKELLLQEGHSRSVYGVSFHPDGSLAASCGLDSYARVWDLRSGRLFFTLKGHVKPVLGVSFSPNGYLVATGSEDNFCRIWDLSAAMPPITSSLLSRSTTGSSTRVSAAAAAAIYRPTTDTAASSPPPPARPNPSPRPNPASPFASGLAGRLFGGHRAAARSASASTAVFERRFASAATRNSYDEILTGLGRPGGAEEFGKYYSLPALSDPRIERLPYSIRILLESAIRNCDGFQVTGKDVEKILDWENSAPKQVEIPFKPARVLLQDFTGVPAVVDLACMRDAMSKLGSDPNKINPLVPVDLVIDHSVQVDVARSQNAVQANMELEFHRNKERFGFLKWGSSAFRNMLVVPPGSGIVHQVNLEYLARVVFNNGGILYPDSVVGTDSHTTMIDGLGVAGWGVGGIEAEAAMLGQPMSMVLPGVVGFKLSGKLRNGVTATDLVLTVTQMLRKHGVVGKFVEFYGQGMSELSLADRATIANMSPEYGATMGFFPVDGKTLDYLKLTGRTDDTVAMVESYLRANKMFVDYNQVEAERVYSSYLELNLEEVEPCLSGPKRPHDRVTLKNMKSDWLSCLDSDVGFKGFAIPKESQGKVAEFSFHGTPAKLKHGDVVIAAITSCTNTSNPNVMLGAALVAKKACELGLEVKPWIKTSLAPGSGVVKKYLDKSGLQKYLDQLGFHIVGYGCTTCIGNSGELDESVSSAISENDIVAAAVLSGNRNFEGRVHPLTRANYLASPPLVVAYALAGTVNIDFEKEPIGISKDGKEVSFRDIWPSTEEIAEVVKSSVLPDMFKSTYEVITKGNPMWNELPVSTSTLYPWDPSSTYIHEPPYFKDMTMTPPGPRPVKDAYCLLNFGDSITTDHISPAGSIHPDSPAAKYLKERGVEKKDFNSYGSRRGNDEIMARGTFANIRIVNKFLKGEVGPKTIHIPSGEKLAVSDAAMKYKNEGHDTIILAGAEYGSGSSRDWAAKGPMLQGVKAVITKSFERIHRSNLAGMGIIPLCFKAGEDADTLGLTGHERYTIHLPANVSDIKPGQDVTVTTDNGKSFTCTLRFDTEVELAYYDNGGILPYVIRKMAEQ